ncbi:MAG TPA: DUF3467 domain-containing protein [Blastocatellia bacterium]|nr:DUF3467 domain-containing protein [Blastocatellia bacterium]
MSEELPAGQDSPEKEEGSSTLPSEKAPHYRMMYSNAVSMFKTAWDFRFDFGTLIGGSGTRPLGNEEQVSILMSPQHAKVFVLIALREIKLWEDRFGPIVLSPEMLKGFGLDSIDNEVVEDDTTTKSA